MENKEKLSVELNKDDGTMSINGIEFTEEQTKAVDEFVGLFTTQRLKEFLGWLKDRFDSRIDMARDQYFYALNRHNTLDCCLWSREQNVLQRTHDFLDSDLEKFLEEYNGKQN